MVLIQDTQADLVSSPYVATLVRRFRSRIESVIATGYEEDGYPYVRGVEHLDRFLCLVAANLPEPEYGMSATVDGLVKAVWEDSRAMCTLRADLEAGTAEWQVRSKQGGMTISDFDDIWSEDVWHCLDLGFTVALSQDFYAHASIIPPETWQRPEKREKL